MIRGSGYWTYDPDAGAWYFGLNERASPPYQNQLEVHATLDLDADGRLAIEIIDRLDDGKFIEPPKSVSGRK